MSKAKAIAGLDCDTSAAEGIRLLLQTRFTEMNEFQAAALDWTDIEGVHDMRVASRRLRSALRDVAPNLNQRKLQKASNKIKAIADALGAVRDDDVAIAALEKLAAKSPAGAKPGIKLLAVKRRERRECERRALADAISKDRLDKLHAEFDHAVQAALALSRKGRKKDADNPAESSLRSVGQGILQARIEELRDSSSSLHQPLKSKPLHRMRIAAKRLRYAIELFSQCWTKRLEPFAKEVAEIQGSLGDLHDCDVWIDELGSRLEKQNQDNPATNGHDAKRTAAIWLLSHFTNKRTQNYRNALARWHAWEVNHFFARLEKCINESISNKVQLKVLEVSHAPNSITPAIEAHTGS